MHEEPSSAWNLRTIRQAARVLGAQSSWVGDVQGAARAQRVVRDMLERRGIATEMFHVPGTMPLVVAGSGPVLLVTFLDDTNLTAKEHQGAPPVMRDNVAVSPGIIRKAGVLAAVGALIASPRNEQLFTLAIEADRHAGSASLEQWLDRTGKRFSAALCEVVDLPAPAPAVFPAATGRLVVHITLDRERGGIEDLYGGVVSDLGHRVAAIVASIKSLDAEVALPGFYDTVVPPSSADIHALDAIAKPFGTLIRQLDDDREDSVNDRHAAMAVFLAPSIVVRGLSLAENGPFLPRSATATLDIQLVPGQHTPTVLRSIIERAEALAPSCRVTASVVRPPVVGQLRERIDGLKGVTSVPVAPGSTPAGLIEERGTPTLGYAVVARETGITEEAVDLRRIEAGTETIRSIAAAVLPRR